MVEDYENVGRRLFGSSVPRRLLKKNTLRFPRQMPTENATTGKENPTHIALVQPYSTQLNQHFITRSSIA